MTDDEIMAAYPGLIQAAAERQDQAEMQRLVQRMVQAASRRGMPAPTPAK